MPLAKELAQSLVLSAPLHNLVSSHQESGQDEATGKCGVLLMQMFQKLVQSLPQNKKTIMTHIATQNLGKLCKAVVDVADRIDIPGDLLANINDFAKVLSFVEVGDADADAGSDMRTVLPHESLALVEKIQNQEAATHLFATLQSLPEGQGLLAKLHEYYTWRRNVSKQLDGLAKLQRDVAAAEENLQSLSAGALKNMMLAVQRLGGELKGKAEFELIPAMSSRLSAMALQLVARHVDTELVPCLAALAKRADAIASAGAGADDSIAEPERTPPCFTITVLRDHVGGNKLHCIFRAHDALESCEKILFMLARNVHGGHNSLDEPGDGSNVFPAPWSLEVCEVRAFWDQLCDELRACSQSTGTTASLWDFLEVLRGLCAKALSNEGRRCQGHIKAQVCAALESDNPDASAFDNTVCQKLQRFAAADGLQHVVADDFVATANAAEVFFVASKASLSYMHVRDQVLKKLTTKPSADIKGGLEALCQVTIHVRRLEERGLNVFLVDLLGNDPDELENVKELARKTVLRLIDNQKEWVIELRQMIVDKLVSAVSNLQLILDTVPAWQDGSFAKPPSKDDNALVAPITQQLPTTRGTRQAASYYAQLAGLDDNQQVSTASASGKKLG